MVRVMLSYWNKKFADFEEQERGVDHLEQEVQQAVNTLDNYRQYFKYYASNSYVRILFKDAIYPFGT